MGIDHEDIGFGFGVRSGVLVSDIVISSGSVAPHGDDGGVVQFIGEVGYEMCFSREPDAGESGCVGRWEFASGVWKVQAGVLVHSVADLPWISDTLIFFIVLPVVFFEADWAH